MLFTRNEVTFMQENIVWKNEAKYLGFHLEKRMTFKTHVDKLLERVCKLLRLIYQFLKRKSKLNLKKKLVYTAYKRPILTYEILAWITWAYLHRKKLQIKQNKILKMIMNLPPWHNTHDLRDIINIVKNEEFIGNLNEKYIIKCNQSSDNINNQLGNSL